MDAAARANEDRARAKAVKAKKAAKKAMAKAKAKARAEARCELCHGSLGLPGEACQGVLLTISCSRCAHTCRSAEGMLLASQTRAKEEFKVGQPDLGLIRHITKTNPYNSRSPIKLYVRSELQVLHKRSLAAAAEHQAKKMQKGVGDKEIRLERLVKRHKINHESVINPALKRAIFGDYMDPLTKPTTKLAEVRAAFRLREQAMRTLPSNPARALNFFVLNKMKAPADDDEGEQAAMSAKFWENADLLDAVVAKQPVAKLIVQFLTPAEARRIQLETNLRRLVETANMRDGQERKRLKTALEKLGGIPDVDVFLADVAVADRLKRFDDYGSDEVVVAQRLHEFHRLRGDRSARRRALKKALVAHDVSSTGLHGSAASLSHDFVEGAVDLDAEEVAGRVKICLHVSRLCCGALPYNVRHVVEAAEKKFRTFLHFEGLGFQEAYERSIKGCRAARHGPTPTSAAY